VKEGSESTFPLEKVRTLSCFTNPADRLHKLDELVDGDLGPLLQPDVLFVSKSASFRCSVVNT
jgi:hypothetical protein